MPLSGSAYQQSWPLPRPSVIRHGPVRVHAERPVVSTVFSSSASAISSAAYQGHVQSSPQDGSSGGDGGGGGGNPPSLLDAILKCCELFSNGKSFLENLPSFIAVLRPVLRSLFGQNGV